MSATTFDALYVEAVRAAHRGDDDEWRAALRALFAAEDAPSAESTAPARMTELD